MFLKNKVKSKKFKKQSKLSGKKFSLRRHRYKKNKKYNRFKSRKLSKRQRLFKRGGSRRHYSNSYSHFRGGLSDSTTNNQSTQQPKQTQQPQVGKEAQPKPLEGKEAQPKPLEGKEAHPQPPEGKPDQQNSTSNNKKRLVLSRDVNTHRIFDHMKLSLFGKIDPFNKSSSLEDRMKGYCINNVHHFWYLKIVLIPAKTIVGYSLDPKNDYPYIQYIEAVDVDKSKELQEQLSLKSKIESNIYIIGYGENNNNIKKIGGFNDFIDKFKNNDTQENNSCELIKEKEITSDKDYYIVTLSKTKFKSKSEIESELSNECTVID